MFKSSKPYFIVLTVILLGYFILQGFLFFSKPVKTEKLFLSSADDFIPCEGLIIRNEEAIIEKSAGTCQFSVKEGEKVSTKSKLAVIYPAGAGNEVYNEIDELDKKIERLQKSTGSGELSSNDAIKNEQKIKEQIIELAGLSQSRNTANAFDITDNLRVSFDQKQIILGQMSTLKSDLQSAKEKRDKLMSASGASVMSTVYSTKTGYFSQIFDGYENLLNPDFILDKPYEDFKEIYDLTTPSAMPAGYVGKIISDFVWYIAVTIPTDSLKTKIPGDTLQLYVEGISSETITAKLERMESTPDGDYCIFSTDYYNESIARLRRVKVQVVTKTYSGYRVNKLAVRIIDDETGIFTLHGSVLDYKKVNVSYSTDEYYIVSQADNTRSALYEGQLVVIDGKNLFDGKVVK